MDGYTKAAIKEALAKRSPLQLRFNEFMNRLINGPMLYVLATLFYGIFGWLIWEAYF